MKSYLKNNWPYILILVILILVTYGNALNNAFLSDDIAEIRDNPNLGNLGYAISLHPFGFIRPFLYWLAYHLGDLNPIFFRSINLFFHMGSTLLIYTLLDRLNLRRVGLIVAAIFAVHPAIAEGVVWISGGMYPQYTFFFLLSFLLYFTKYYWASVGSYLLSFMSHPIMPLPLFSIYLLWELLFGNLRKNYLKILPFLALTIVYVFVNLASIPERATTLQSIHYQERGVDNLFILIPVAISSYLELIFWPKVLTLYHSELAFGVFEFSVRSLLTAIFLGATILSFKFNKLILFFLALFWIALSPTLTPFRFNWIVAERYLYFPILGVLTVLGLGILQLEKLLKFKWGVYVILTLIIILLSGRTIIRNIDWKNEDNLWIATGKTSPSSPNTHNNLGDMYGRWGEKQKAIQEFQKAIELKPNYGDAYHNLGNAYREIGEYEKALENYQNAIKFNPNLWPSYQNIAALYFESKQYDKALENIQKAIQINPKNPNLVVNLGIVYLFSGDKEKAKEVFQAVLNADPQNQVARQGLIEASK